ncbi:hypothetical protein BLNAU_15202 [Blattamonas nauphoetae]|uniref:Uncharacterized protein n=1 Tax=Blattamonas nauphoetae TaxID=2049346 RepID=A0ABQ9XGB8_9EUKA|nr:hypothetical protein BLNAU_15202 [Blattamonas nauphoetae]
MNAILTVVLLTIIPTSHPKTFEENSGPSLNRLLITSCADISLSSSTPNCLHLSTSTWIASTIRLASKDVSVIGSEQTIIATVSGKQLADNHRNHCDSDSSANCPSSSVFTIQNTTLSLASLTFDLVSGIVVFVHFILHFRTTKPGFLACVLSELEFSCFGRIGGLPCGCAVSPFKLVPSTFDSESSCSLTVSLCMLKNSGNQIGSVLEIDPALPPTESISMSLSSIHLDSQTLTSNSGLSFSSSPSEYGLTNDCQIQSVVSDCQFFNLSSNPAHPTSLSFRWLRERIVGCEVRCVVKSMEGTLTTRLGKQNEFLIQNSSLLECVNEEETETTKSYDYLPEITSSAQRINHGSEFTHYVFQGCTIKATNMTSSFVLITLNPITGNVKFVGCSFEVECHAQHITLVSATAVRANKVKCLIDTCTFKFWRETETSTGNNQISLFNFQEVCIVSSTFSPPTSKFSSARAVSLSNPVSFLFFSNTSFVRQTSNGNGGALNLPFSLIRFFHCHFDGNKANQGGAVSTASIYHYFTSCTFTRNEATKWGGAIYSGYLLRLRMFDCHFDQIKHRGNTRMIKHNLHIIVAMTSSLILQFGMEWTGQPCLDAHRRQRHRNMDIFPQIPTMGFIRKMTSCFLPRLARHSQMSSSWKQERVGCVRREIHPSLINLGNGIFEEDTLDISKRVELRGLGFFVNTSTFTTLKTSCVVSADRFEFDNPGDAVDKPVVPVECEDRVHFWSSRPLLSFSSGTSTVHSSWLSSIKMENHAAIEITGSASVTFHAAWFMEIARVSGNGGSCIDSSTSGVISFIQTNMAHCSSSGRAGCLDLIASSSNSQVIFNKILFTKNTVTASISLFGNDIAHTSFVPSKISTISNCRSLSALPHILVNNTFESNLVCSTLFFTSNGIDHPFATDFEQGVPLSWFRGFREEIDAMMESSTEVLLRISDPQTFTPFEITRKTVAFMGCSLTPKFYDRRLVFVGVSGYLRFASTAMTFSNAPTVIPFVVAPTAKDF